MKHWFKISRASSGIYTCVVHAWHITTSWKVQYPFPKHLHQSDQIRLSIFFFFLQKVQNQHSLIVQSDIFLIPNWAQCWRVTSEIRHSTSQVAIDLIKIIITKEKGICQGRLSLQFLPCFTHFIYFSLQVQSGVFLLVKWRHLPAATRTHSHHKKNLVGQEFIITPISKKKIKK